MTESISLEEARERRKINGSDASVTSPDDWPDPEISVLNEGRRPPPTFPVEPLGKFWGKWIQDAAEVKGSTPDYVGISLLVTAASLIGNARRISPWPEWQEPSIMWGCAVGLPSSGKSPAMDAVMAMLDTLQEEMEPDYEIARQRYEADREAAKLALEGWKQDVKNAVEHGSLAPVKPDSAIEPRPPIRPRLYVSDTTPEQLGNLLSAFPKGLLAKRDELAGWLGNMDRYGGGKGDRALWLEAFGGRPYAIDRVKLDGDPIMIRNLSVSVLGNMVPDKVPTVMGSDTDDGLAARFLFVWPEPAPIRRPTRTLDTRAALRALRRLRDLEMAQTDDEKPAPIVLPLTDEAVDIFQKWREANARDERAANGLYLGHLGKLPGILLRIALVLEFLHWSTSGDASPPDRISAESIGRAADFTDEYLKPMSQRVCGDAALPAAERHAAAIARKIVAERLETINASMIRREWKLHGLEDAGGVKAALDVLEEAGWIRRAPSRTGETKGRHSSDHMVNPKVLEIA